MAPGMPQTRSMLLFGTDEPTPPVRHLVAGDLSVEIDRGNLRHVRWGGLEVIRGISFIVRDKQWGTYTPVIDELEVVERQGSFAVSYRATCASTDGAFVYNAKIEGGVGGHVLFRARGVSPAGFETNRTGFVVLHPLDGVVGRAVEIEHASGGRSRSRFPVLVDPGTPATDIRALRHEPRPGLRVTVRMEGEAFEMEDHRNWTDASFKTYVRPLALGYPYRIPAGEPVAQSVELTIDGPVPVMAHDDAPAIVTLGDEWGTAPRTGLFVESEAMAEAGEVAMLVADVGASFLTGRVDLRREDLLAQFTALQALARSMTTPLALEVVIPGVAPAFELAPLSTAIAASRQDIESILVVPARDLKSRATNTLPNGEAAPEAILAAARAAFPSMTVGGGMTVPFPELNRNRPPGGIDFVTHATQATMHDADDIAVMETIEALPHVIRSTRDFAGDIPYRLGPATIGMPASASATSPVSNPTGSRICMAGDEPRQRSLFAAAFALGFFAVAAREGIDAVTFASPAGEFGLFDAETKQARPLALVVKRLASLASLRLIKTTVLGGDKVAAFAAAGPGGPVLWIANLTPEPVAIGVDGADFQKRLVIDASTLARGVDRLVEAPFKGDTIDLDAYAVCSLR